MLVGATPLGFGVDNPAACGCRLQSLGLSSPSLAEPLVPSGRALVPLRVSAVPGNLQVGGFAPLRLGLDGRVGGDRHGRVDQRPVRQGFLQHLGTSARFVRRLVFERRIAYVKLGRHVRIATRDLDAFIAASRVDVSELPAVARKGA